MNRYKAYKLCLVYEPEDLDFIIPSFFEIVSVLSLLKGVGSVSLTWKGTHVKDIVLENISSIYIEEFDWKEDRENFKGLLVDNFYGN